MVVSEKTGGWSESDHDRAQKIQTPVHQAQFLVHGAQFLVYGVQFLVHGAMLVDLKQLGSKG